MEVVINGTSYTQLASLTFSTETDVTGSSAPVNEFSCDIMTDDTIQVGTRAALYDGLGNLWAKYWVTYAERKDKETVEVRAQSALMLLDRVTLPATMYTGQTVGSVLQTVMAPISGEYELESGFASVQLNGYAPEQTARERLQWIVLVIGAYVRHYFGEDVQILSVKEDTLTIPMEYTYYKPSVTYTDYVTAIRAKAYSYVQREPQTKERWVEVNDTPYVETEQTFELSNPDVPAIAPANVIEVQNVTLINEDNVDEILSHLAKYYFTRCEVDFEAVDDAQWYAGQRVMVSSDMDEVFEGYIDNASFEFGVRAKASIHVTSAEGMDSATLTIRYLWDTKQMGVRHYTFPEGYEYKVENVYLDVPWAGHRYVFRPINEYAEGTVQVGGTTDNQPVTPALDLYNGVLSIISVDEYEDEEGTAVIA